MPARIQIPEVENQVAAAGVEGQRAAGPPPDVGGAVVDRDVEVQHQDLRIGHVGHGSVDCTRERETLWELTDHLPVGLDTEALQRRRKQDADDRTLAHRVDELLVAALGHDADLSSQIALPIVVELPVGELRLVRALDRHEEDLLERTTVVGDRELRQNDRQVDAAQQVLHLLVFAGLGHERLGTRLELLGRDELHLGCEGALSTSQDGCVVNLRLHEVELPVGIHHLALEAGLRDATTVLVDQRLGRVAQNDLVVAGEDRLERLLAAVLTAAGDVRLLPEGFLLSTAQTTPDLGELAHDSLHCLRQPSLSLRWHCYPFPGSRSSRTRRGFDIHFYYRYPKLFSLFWLCLAKNFVKNNGLL